MKKYFIHSILLAVLLLLTAYNSFGQCKRVGLIGEFTAWADDLFMNRDPENPAMFTAMLILTSADDTSEPADGIVELKFREDANWTVNWGDAAFPSGTAVQNGANIPVPVGAYLVSFNCETGAYNFLATCGSVSMIGEFNGWADDYPLVRDAANPDEWSVTISFSAADDTNSDGIVEAKFRENGEWTVNWGDAAFPSGTATQNGPNIPVPVGSYKVDFNCATGEYTFTSTCGSITLIGEFNGWAGDFALNRDPDNPDLWSVIFQLEETDDTNTDGIVELKFRENADWVVNWGDTGFPSGTGVQNGPNIPVPVGTGLFTTYAVSFNCATGEYNFQSACGPISMIGAFNNWNGDVPMNRDAADPDVWSLTRSWYADSEVKFRENNDWSVNWGNSTWPSGTGTPNGPNIPLVAGVYDVAFNCATGDYNFTTNSSVCGEIGMVGDFNAWGDDGSGIPTDVNLIRDPLYPSQFSLTYNFTSGTKLLFREDADVAFINVWGGTFPTGTGVQDAAVLFDVPGGKYHITFNCKSGDYNFERLGNSVIAPKVFSLNVDGDTGEKDWNFSQNVSNIVEGASGADDNTVQYAVAYNDEYLYIGVNVTDGEIAAGGTPAESDAVHVFIDGNKSGGAYDASDVYFIVDGSGAVTVVNGSAVPEGAFGTTGTGYAVEVKVAWDDLGVTPAVGGQIGFDLGVTDRDAGALQNFMLWNGGTGNYTSTSSFGDLLFGGLSCGEISIYNDFVGDITLHTPTDFPTSFVGTYEFDANQNVVFRKDRESVVTWGSTDFPSGTAALGGSEIPATTGRYRVSFDCLTGSYSFADESGVDIAYAHYTTDEVVMDGLVDEYSLDYGMDAGVVDGTGPANNTVVWGALWDETNLYIGAQVTDAVVEGSGNPWENDGIEYYIDGNHDSDGPYDGDFDTQLIMDFFNDDVLWAKADGVPITDGEGVFESTATGYTVEIRVAWSNFRFVPGRNRAIGFTIGNNDSDNGLGRDYQTAWTGTANNWNDTGVHGDLQLAEGPYNDVHEIYRNASIAVFPNPVSANSSVFIATDGQTFNGDAIVSVFSMYGQQVSSQKVDFNGTTLVNVSTGSLTPGTYVIYVLSADGKTAAVKKLMVH